MRSLLLLLTLIILITACREDEVLTPMPPASDAEAADEASVISQEDITPLVYIDSNFYQAGQFKNLPYRILFPRDYDSTAHYPMLIFLHGVGERGSDNEKQLNIGGSYFLRDSIRQNYKAFIVYPQCPADSYWTDDAIAQNVKELADVLQRQIPVAKHKIVLGGFSMGAYGTFEIVSRFPGYFESALAIAGAGDPRKAPFMAGSRWRIFASMRDNVVPSAESKAIADAIRKTGGSVDFKLFGEPDHGSTWVHAFREPGLFSWLFDSD